MGIEHSRGVVQYGRVAGVVNGAHGKQHIGQRPEFTFRARRGGQCAAAVGSTSGNPGQLTNPKRRIPSHECMAYSAGHFRQAV